MSYSCVGDRFTCLVDFLLFHKEAMVHSLYRGDVAMLKASYKQFCVDCVHKCPADFDDDEFARFLVDFNVISADSLVFASPKKLAGIKVANIELLQRRLQSSSTPNWCVPDKKIKSFTNAKLHLVCLLSMPLHTGVRDDFGEFSGFDNLDRLRDILSDPTAMTVLGIQRAQMLTERKPFYEVCEVASHNQTLANLCLNVKAMGLSMHDLPSNAKTHKAIQSCKALMSKDIASCVRTKIHYLPLVTASTDMYLGNCLYLDTCHKMKGCRYLHFYTLYPPVKKAEHTKMEALEYTVGECMDTMLRVVLPPQWINCDVRTLPFSILGKFAAIICDPAWDIHMSLPFGTGKDSEFLLLPMGELQDEGILLLWVTVRSIEIGRRALMQWGYEVSDEVIWIKTNQLRRTIVTGRTGHWLNHSKEHLLLGVKGNPVWLARKIDLDIIVSGTRETLRKPDELYDMVERMVGRHARKLEIFGRDHNIRPGWFSMYSNKGSHITNTQPLETRSQAHASTRRRCWPSIPSSSSTSSYCRFFSASTISYTSFPALLSISFFTSNLYPIQKATSNTTKKGANTTACKRLSKSAGALFSCTA